MNLGAMLAQAAERLRASVVQLRVGATGGAGVAWDDDGTIVTCSHVIAGDTVEAIRPDGRRMVGQVIRRDQRRDLAVIRLPGTPLPSVRWIDPTALRPGSLLFAVGHPFGVKDAVSAGVFQALGLVPSGFGLPEPQRELAWVQADVRLAPGNSGGPLADVTGRVVGIATMVAAGLALAVPSAAVDAMVRQQRRTAARSAGSSP